jgi:hypothetical protein
MPPHHRESEGYRSRRPIVYSSFPDENDYSSGQDSDRIQMWAASLAQYGEQNQMDAGDHYPSYEEIDSREFDEAQALKTLKIR